MVQNELIHFVIDWKHIHGFIVGIVTLQTRVMGCNNKHIIKGKCNMNTTRHKIFMETPKLGENH